MRDLGLGGAAITVMPTTQAHTVLAASDQRARDLETAHLSVGEGPTIDAYGGRRPVLVGDLAATGFSRWPGYTALALQGGVCGVCAFPLHVGAAMFGALTLYLDAPRRLTPEEVRQALVFADLATDLLVDTLPGSGLDEPGSGLRGPLAAHEHIHQAQGMVMVALGVSLPEALARMRAHAFATGEDLATLAADIVAGRTMLPRDGNPQQ